MITKQNILERAKEWGLRPEIVEKDYVLGWLVVGIANHPELGVTWVFKGGTCIKKCYFETYRFSEDLDFSLRSSALYSTEDLLRQVKEVAGWVYEQSGIEFPEGGISVEAMQNKQGQPTFRAKLTYRGPLAMPTGPRVLFDLTQHEVVAAPPEQRPVYHPYPDEFPEGSTVSAYSLEELFAEKTRALYERTRPRDLYDVVQLMDNHGDEIDFVEARALFRAKCESKGIPVPSSAALVGLVQGSRELEGDWNTMLARQLPALPPLDGVRSRLPAALSWIDEPAPPILPAPAEASPPPAEATSPFVPLPRVAARPDEEVVAPAGVRFWGGQGPLELIRFAGANRLMIAFEYNGKPRVVEPYSLRRASTGNLLLYALEESAGHVKAFKVGGISGLTVTDRTFVPSYAIELTSIASVPARAQRPSGARLRRASSGVVYVFECPYCNKTFRHTRNDPTLRAHKRLDGYGDCSGRRGYLVRNDYS